jgi:hypothetical protein
MALEMQHDILVETLYHLSMGPAYEAINHLSQASLVCNSWLLPARKLLFGRFIYRIWPEKITRLDSGAYRLRAIHASKRHRETSQKQLDVLENLRRRPDISILLRHLEISYSVVGGIRDLNICKMFPMLTKLNISVHDSKVASQSDKVLADTAALSDVFAGCRELKALNLSVWMNIDPASRPSNPTWIVPFALKDFRLGAPGTLMVELTAALANATSRSVDSLRRLHLRYDYADVESILHCHHKMGAFVNLQQLYIDFYRANAKIEGPGESFRCDWRNVMHGSHVSLTRLDNSVIPPAG